MDYKDKYIKYKTKYLELKNMDINNQIGGGSKNNKILFIMFPGNLVIKKGWDVIDYDSKNKKFIRNNFIREIRKLGDIYFYEPTYYNIYSYYEKNEKWWGKNPKIDFSLDDIDVEKVCSKIYDDVKDFNGKIILLGHSMGAYFVYYFGQRYFEKCLFGIVIDGMFISKEPEENFKVNLKKYLKYTNEDIKNLLQDVKNSNKKSIEKLSDIFFFNIANYSNIIRNIKKFNIPILSFYNYETDCKNKVIIKLNEARNNDINHIRKYNDDINFKIITFLNKTHFPHHIEEAKNIIIENIKLFISKYN
tara:strand:+ start:564 stop:1475 length:912 start_codon:yes stop_codon:yes gene_type:complete